MAVGHPKPVYLNEYEIIVFNALIGLSKRYADGKGGLSAEDILRAARGALNSRILVDVLGTLYQRKLITFADTDGPPNATRRLWYIVRRPVN